MFASLQTELCVLACRPGHSVLTEPIGSVLRLLKKFGSSKTGTVRFLKNRNRSVLFKTRNREISGLVLSVRFRLKPMEPNFVEDPGTCTAARRRWLPYRGRARHHHRLDCRWARTTATRPSCAWPAGKAQRRRDPRAGWPHAPLEN